MRFFSLPFISQLPVYLYKYRYKSVETLKTILPIATPPFLLIQVTYCTVDDIINCVAELILSVEAGSEDGAAVSIPDRTSEQAFTEKTPREREASSNLTGMNEWSGERWDTVTDVCS